MAKRYGGHTTLEDYKQMFWLVFWIIVIWVGLAYVLANAF